MKLYTTVSHSYRAIYENYFCTSFPSHEFELIEKRIPDGNRNDSNNFANLMYNKVAVFHKACSENMGQVFIYCDSDAQFFKPIKDVAIKELEDFDIACQYNGQDLASHLGYCSGFFICRCNENTKHMFDCMLSNYEHEDQYTLNKFIHKCKHKTLSHKFFSILHVTHKEWHGEQAKVPEDILMHHANWTAGMGNKINLLNMVRSQVQPFQPDSPLKYQII